MDDLLGDIGTEPAKDLLALVLVSLNIRGFGKRPIDLSEALQGTDASAVSLWIICHRFRLITTAEIMGCGPGKRDLPAAFQRLS